MQRFWRKFRNNIFNMQAVRVLGPWHYLRYLCLFFLYLPRIISDRTLLSMDAAVGRRLNVLRYRGNTIRYECRFGDERVDSGQLAGGNHAFSFIREIYIRDCYFRFMPEWVYNTARVVVDLGLNVGIFSSLLTPVAERIIGVDVNPEMLPVAEHNLALNGLEDFTLIRGFVGRGGMFDPDGAPFLTMEGLIDNYGLERIDLLKLDIEGSEFPLFEDDTWLARVNAITMEVHSGYPGLDMMMRAIQRHGFEFVLANQDLYRVERAQDAEFLCAWKPAC